MSNICVYATTDANKPIAIIIPHEHNIRAALPAGFLEDADLPTLCHEEKVKELVLKECNAIGKKNGFKPIETLQAVVLTAEEWTPVNGFVTAAQKIQRKKIADAFDAEIKVSTFSGLGMGGLLIGWSRRRTKLRNPWLTMDRPAIPLPISFL